MTPLRQRMIEDMNLRHFAENTQKAYLRAVIRLSEFYGKSPDQLSNEQVRQFLLHLTEAKGIARSTYIQYLCALRFFFRHTLGRKDLGDIIIPPRCEKRLPVVLSLTELGQFFGALTSLKHRAILMTAFASGLRIFGSGIAEQR